LGNRAALSEISRDDDAKERNPHLYKSTYEEDGESDKDDFHITMPWRNENIKYDDIYDPTFETDEEFELSDTDKDRQNAEKLDVQNRILDTMQKTI